MGDLRSVADILATDLVIVKLPKHIAALTTEELLSLLKAHPDVWAQAIRRGKFYRRGEATARRCGEQGGSNALR